MTQSIKLPGAGNIALNATKYPPMVRLEWFEGDALSSVTFHCPQPMQAVMLALESEACILEFTDLNQLDGGQRFYGRYQCSIIGDYGDKYSSWIADKIEFLNA